MIKYLLLFLLFLVVNFSIVFVTDNFCVALGLVAILVVAFNQILINLPIPDSLK